MGEHLLSSPQMPHSFQREIRGQDGLESTTVSVSSATGLILLLVNTAASLPAQQIPPFCFSASDFVLVIEQGRFSCFSLTF